eukprot:g244.t2
MEVAQEVLIYRKRALNEAADQMDSFSRTDLSRGRRCGAMAKALEFLVGSFSEARVLAIGGLEILRFGMQDLSCQVCWAAEEQRSQQIFRVVRRDLEAVLRRLGQLRYDLPSWEPCLPDWWKSLAAPSNVVNVSVRRAGTVDRMRSVRQWMESIAVAMTALAGEFQSLSYILQTEAPRGFEHVAEVPLRVSQLLQGQIPAGCMSAPVVPPFDRKVLDRPAAPRAVIFICLHSTFCGGHGDRLFGLLSAYLAALLSGRSFFIDMRTPLPLPSLLHPRKRPWPAVSSACVTYRWTSAEDPKSLEDDIQLFMEDDSEVVCIASNLRLFKALLRYDTSSDWAFARSGLLSGLFLDLFSLAPMPSSLVSNFLRQMQGRQLLGIHFRAGNETTWSDPARHALSDLDLALRCAASVESHLKLPGSAWLLASDTLKIRQHPVVEQLHRAGKVVYLEDRPTHIDRSSPESAFTKEEVEDEPKMKWSRSLSLRLEESRTMLVEPLRDSPKKLRHLMIRRPVKKEAKSPKPRVVVTEATPQAESVKGPASPWQRRPSRSKKKDEVMVPGQLLTKGGITSWSDLGLARRCSDDLGVFSGGAGPGGLNHGLQAHIAIAAVRTSEEARSEAGVRCGGAKHQGIGDGGSFRHRLQLMPDFNNLKTLDLSSIKLTMQAFSSIVERSARRLSSRAKSEKTEKKKREPFSNKIRTVFGQIYSIFALPFGGAGNFARVDQGSVGVVLRFGKFDRMLEPGRHQFNVAVEQVLVVPLKIACIDVQPQMVMTKDNLTVTIDAVCFYRVLDATKVLFEVQNYKQALTNLVQVTMRTVVGENSLSEIFAQRPRLNARITELIDAATGPWGIEVSQVELKEVQIQQSMQRALAAVAEAQQEAEAKLIQAKAQRESASILAEASKAMGRLASIRCSLCSQSPDVGLRSLIRLLVREESGLDRLRFEGCAKGEQPSAIADLQFISTSNPGGRYSLQLDRALDMQ